jgi:site-specific DNA-adenine methylase
MKNHFFMGYFGNKRQEVDKIYEIIKDEINKYKIIVEPFCGSSAFSYYIWLNNKDLKMKYILNDNNENLIKLYNIAKDDNKLNELYFDLRDIYKSIKNKDDYMKVVEKSNNGDFNAWFYVNKIFNIRPGLYNGTSKIDKFDSVLNAPIIEFLRNSNIEILCKDAIEVYDEYKSNKKALIFLDPPYLVSNNTWYKNPSINIYEYLCNNDINKEKAFIILCLEYMWIIKLLFKDKKIIKYDKKYETTKKYTDHVIILNK